MSANATQNSYLWCDACRRSFDHEDAPESLCPICHGEVRAIGKFNAILRGLMANELAPSPLMSKHRQMVKIMWTRNGMGEDYYRVLAPEMSYNKFETAMTNLLCRGADEGWIEFKIPSSPKDDESLYAMNVIDEDKFLEEIQVLAGPEASLEEGV